MHDIVQDERVFGTQDEHQHKYNPVNIFLYWTQEQFIE
jgi:hypothetical protein